MEMLSMIPIHTKEIEAEIRIVDNLDANIVKSNPIINEWIHRYENQKQPIRIVLDATWVIGVSQESVFRPGTDRYATNIRLKVNGMSVQNA